VGLFGFVPSPALFGRLCSSPLWYVVGFLTTVSPQKMLNVSELRAVEVRKLSSAKVLLTTEPDEAIYLAGYAIELRLKAHIVQNHKLPGWPTDRSEARPMERQLAKTLGRKVKLQIHDLADLLTLSGKESAIKTHQLAPWSLCSTWNP
jgi:hypothetical protein